MRFHSRYADLKPIFARIVPFRADDLLYHHFLIFLVFRDQALVLDHAQLKHDVPANVTLIEASWITFFGC